jgi:hypothetical protein
MMKGAYWTTVLYISTTMQLCTGTVINSWSPAYWPPSVIMLCAPELPPSKQKTSQHRDHGSPGHFDPLYLIKPSIEKRDILTLWHQSCPIPSQQCSARDLSEVQAGRIHSSNSHPESWFADNGYPGKWQQFALITWKVNIGYCDYTELTRYTKSDHTSCKYSPSA